MEDVGFYQFVVRGWVQVEDIRLISPPDLTVETVGENSLLQVCADQSGMIGLIRQLHGMGLIILSVYRISKETENTKEDPK